MIPRVLTIAGSDSSGGAGIQADLAAIAANGGYGASVITAVTAQNTRGVRAIHAVPTEIVAAQVDAVLEDLDIAVIKVGMLCNADIVKVLVPRLRGRRYVVDPVLVSSSGIPLLSPPGAIRPLLAGAELVTPNLDEAAILGPLTVPTLVTGGHGDCCDRLGSHVFPGIRVETHNTHGTGCSLSSAIATQLAHGHDLIEAITRAKAWLTGALRAADALDIGRGAGPIDPYWRWR